jgi:purine-binding chemotaxis protein CheW
MSAPRQYLSFFLGGEEYAVDILRVREVTEYGSVTRVPMMPASIRGVVNVHGVVTPVIDLAIKFGFAALEISKWTCIILVEVPIEDEHSVIGIIADSVSQLIEVSDVAIEPVPTFGTRIRAEFLRGMARVGKKFALILDIDRLLSPDEIVSVSAASGGIAPTEPQSR